MSVAGFLKYLEYERRVSKDTIKAYRNDLEKCSQYLQEQYEVSELDTGKATQIRSWLVSLLRAGQANSTVKRKHSALKSYFKYLQKYRGLEQNPMEKVPVPKVGKKLPVFLEGRETERLFDRLEWPEDFPAQRDRLMLSLLYNLGLRRSELIGLTLGDLDWSGRCLRVMGKGSKERIVPFGPELGQEIRNYLELRGREFGTPVAGDALLVTDKGKEFYPKLVYNKVRHYLGLVSSQLNLSPHVLRHTFATHLANNGADLNAIKELLGHSSLAATQVYTHNTIEQLKEIYRQAHPKARSDTHQP